LPNVVGSAWMPWLRPMVGYTCAPGAALDRGEQRVDVGEQDVGGARELHGQQVSSTSELVMPWCMKRASGPTCCATVEEGDHVVLGDGLDRVDRGHVDGRVGRPPVPQRLGAAGGTTPSSASFCVAWASISNQMR
jgi:hypothetical protein